MMTLQNKKGSSEYLKSILKGKNVSVATETTSSARYCCHFLRCNRLVNLLESDFSTAFFKL